MAFLRKNRRGFQVVGLVVALAAVGVLATVAIQGATRATAAVDATISGKVLGPSGTPLSFTCFNPEGGSSACGVWVEAMAGPGAPGSGGQASLTDGSFSFMVTGGQRYRIEFRGPFEQMSQYTFAETFVEIASGESKDLGTITATEKQGRIHGIVRDKVTLVGVANAVVSAFPMFGGPGGEGGGGPMMPSQTTTGSDGSFTLKVDAGRFGINLMQNPESTYVTSGGPPIEANCETATCVVSGITIDATKADATITGFIKDTAGNGVFFPGGVGARPVGATDFFDYSGPIFPEGTPPNQVGKYTIKVPSSPIAQYTLQVHTPPNVNYSVQGTLTVTVTENGTVTQDITVAPDTSAIFGKLVSESGFTMSSCTTSGTDSAKFGPEGRFGEVFANSEKNGKFAHAEVRADCTYEMVLSPGEYRFGYHLNPKAGYINRPGPDEIITVGADTRIEKNITVIAGDAKITGQVFDANGKPVANVWVDAGNENEARENFKTGGQQGSEGPKEGEFRGPGNTKDPQAMMKYCSAKKNEKECKDFKLPPGAEGPGGCKNMLECTQFCTKNLDVCKAEIDKKGAVKSVGVRATSAMGSVKVAVEDVTKKGQGPDFNQNVIHIGTQTDGQGKFTLAAVSGHVYEVRAHIPPDRDTGSSIPPKPAKADLRTAKSVNVALQFRASFGTMTGTVTMPDGSPATRCFVHYWSEGGEDGGSPCSQNGTYTLGYGQGILHIAADSFDGNTPYQSEELVVTVTNQKTLTKNFTLKERGFKVPSPASKTFDASEGATISLDDGTVITVPAGAMGDSGNVTVSATPTIDLKANENNDPIGVGYTLAATDANGQSITEFESNVTVSIPYDEGYVEDDLGLNESLLKSVYKNDTTGAYENTENASQDTDENSFTILTDHFTDFTLVSPGGVNLKSVSVETKGKNTRVTIDSSKKITLPGTKANWNVGTANFGSTAGQYIVVSNVTDTVATKYRGKVLLYNTNGKLKKTWTPFSGFAGGLNQTVADLVAKSGSAPDGTDDVAVAPATTGPAEAAIFNIKQNKKSKVTTGTGTGTTTLNTAELYSAGIANLTTLFNGTTSKAWKMSKGKYKEGANSSNALTVKNGKAEKKTATPKVKKVAGSCSQSTSKTLTVKGKGFGAIGEPILLWNATSALAVQSFTDTAITIKVNPEAVDVNSTNTLTIVNSDGQAGVGIVSCGT